MKDLNAKMKAAAITDPSFLYAARSWTRQQDFHKQLKRNTSHPWRLFLTSTGHLREGFEATIAAFICLFITSAIFTTAITGAMWLDRH